MMPLPGEHTVGRRHGSYSPGEDPNDTPYKPVPLAFQQIDGTLPADSTDHNKNANNNRARTRREAAARRNRKKAICILVICVLVIFNLAVVLPLMICLTTDFCSSSSSTSSESSKSMRAHQARLGATLTAPVISDPGNPPFGEFLNVTLETNGTSASNTTTPVSIVTIARRRRDVINQNNTNTTVINLYSPIDRYVMDKIQSPLLDSIKSSSLCRDIDCTDLSFGDFRLDNDVLSSRFSLSIGSDQPLSIDPSAVLDTTASVVKNFSGAFSGVFPGYQLGEVDLAFDLMEFCNYTSVYCSNFTNINDTYPSSTPTTTTTTPETTTFPDRSVLLPDNETFEFFNVSITDQPPAVSTWSTRYSSTSSLPNTRPTAATIPRLPGGMLNCSRYGFMCTNQAYRVATRERCDGVIQCPDGSDEQFCEACRTSFSCPNGDGSWMCLRGKVICDGKSSCPTDYDEGPLHCKSICLASEYRCRNSNACIPKRWLCDGDIQCPYGDDEVDCSIPSKCNNNAFFCAADLRCIPAWSKCNGVDDCSDGADELRCTCLECSGNRTALCPETGKCILKTQLCDGKKDCPNGEDENLCTS